MISNSTLLISVIYDEYENDPDINLKQNLKLKNKIDYEEWFLPISLHILKEKQNIEMQKLEKIYN